MEEYKQQIRNMRSLAYQDMLKLIRGVSDLETSMPIQDGDAKHIVLDYYHAKYLRWEAEAWISKGKRKERAEKRAFACLDRIHEIEAEKRVESPKFLRGNLDQIMSLML